MTLKTPKSTPRKIAYATTALLTAAALVISGCETSGYGYGGGAPTTQQKITRCAALIGGGAIIGGIIGNNTGSGDAKKGATTGAIIGAGACAGWLLLQNRSNRMRYDNAQYSAARTGTPYSDQWRDSESGQTLAVRVDPSAPQSMRDTVTGEIRTCRTLNTNLSASSNSDSLTETWCANGDGTWSVAQNYMAPVQ